ncbi:RNA polymerase sigma factor [Paenibacillus gallinarum]|uniref:Sigma-70 family RNA polymerase sigma factor n=1 Tax=Paenibacillus gallinarum TaxID=2762232 RepID=A0ABR8SUZ7_9BACL|nr:sigma-70 family RNA polymerase sigma factor [Paenibacillus gallinarum]MBD7967329.1 sigma-70 family RNA polymerase sigma factor [Paenibacillus gallinarum]
MDEYREHPADDQVLRVINRVREGDSEAYLFIVEIYQQKIFMYCWRLLGNRQDAEDAVQEILIKAYQNLKDYRDEAHFQSWLYMVAYHHCLNVIRRVRLLHRIAPLFRSEKYLSDGPEQELEKWIFSEPLEKALHKLSADERNIVILYIFEDKSFNEISAIVNKSMESVKKRYSRSRQKLKKWIEESKGENEWEVTQTIWKRS